MSIFSSTKSLLAEKLASIESGSLKVESYARLVRWETEKSILNGVDDIMENIKKHAQWSELQSLSPVSSLDDHAKQSRGRVRDTGQWLLDQGKFHDWRYSARSSLMILGGSVGTGKTMLTSLVIDGFLDDLRPVAGSPVLYFYGNPKYSPQDALRNLVKQTMMASYDAKKPLDQGLPWDAGLSTTECGKRIKEFIKTQQSAAIVIDAIDKCTPAGTRGAEATSRYTFLNLFQDLRNMMKDSPRPVKLFISYDSSDDGIEGAFNGEDWQYKYCLSTEDQPNTDVRRVIQDEVDRWASGQLLPSLDQPGQDSEAKQKAATIRAKAKSSIVEVISQRAGHMFSWAIAVLGGYRDDFKKLRTENDVKNELLHYPLPTTLQGLYDMTFDKLYSADSSPSSRAAGNAVRLLFCSKKPLSGCAFIDAVKATESQQEDFSSAERQINYSDEQRNLVSSCLGWVVYDGESDTFRFQHPSIEYYLQKKSSAGQYEIQSHAVMAEACLRAILERNRQMMEVEGRTESGETSPERGRSLDRSSQGSSRVPYKNASGSVENGPRSVENGPRSVENGPRSVSPLQFVDDDGNSPGSFTHGRARGGGRRDSSVSSKSSTRSLRPNRPQSRHRSRHNSPGDDPPVRLRRTLSSASVWSVAQNLTRALQTDVGMDDPIQSFPEYGNIYWLSHYQSAQEVLEKHDELKSLVDDMLMDSDLEDEQSLFNVWVADVQKLLGQRPVGFYSEELETQLEDCIVPPPSPMQVAGVYGLEAIFGQLWDDSNDSTPLRELQPNNQGMTLLHLACKFGQAKVIKLLFGRTPEENRLEMLGTVDGVGKTALQHAVEVSKDTTLVKDILAFPGSKGVEQLGTRSGVLIAAMQNAWCSKDLMPIFLGRRLDRRGIDKSDQLAIECVKYPHTTIDLINYLAPKQMAYGHLFIPLAQCELPRGIDWRQREKIWNWLSELPRCRPDLYDAAGVAIRRNDKRLLKYLLKKAKISQKEDQNNGYTMVDSWSMSRLLQIAVSAGTRPGVVDVLTEHFGTSFTVSERDLEAALENPEMDETLMAKLVDHLEGNMVLSTETLDFLSKNTEHGADVLGVILAKGGVTFEPPVDDDREQEPSATYSSNWISAVSSGNIAILKLFLGPMKIPVTPDHLRLVVSEAPQERFLELTKAAHATIARGAAALESETPEDHWDGVVCECISLMAKTLSNCSGVGLSDGGVVQTEETPRYSWITQDVVEKSVLIRGPKVLSFLLQNAPSDGPDPVSITSDMAVRVVNNTTYGHAILPLLEKKATNRDLLLGKEVLETAARHGDLRTIKFLLGDRPLDLYSPGFRLAAAANPDLAVVKYTFSQIRDIQMNELEAAAANSDTAFEWILNCYPRSKSSEFALPSSLLTRVIAAHCKRSRTLRHALDVGVASGPTPEFPPQELLKSAVANRHGLDMANFVLESYEMTANHIKITSDILLIAAGNESVAPEMLRLLLSHANDRKVESLITTSILVKAAKNAREGSEALRMLLLELRAEKISDEDREKVREAISGNPDSDVRRRATAVFQVFLSE